MIKGKMGDIKQDGKAVVKKTASQPWVGWMTRVGYAVRGVLYILIGLLAVQVAAGTGKGQITDQRGAIAAIAAQPFGKILLIIVAIGLVGYAIWGLVRAVVDPLNKGNDAKGIITRIGYLVSAISYGALVPGTLGYVFGSGPGKQSSPQQMSAGILTKSWGPWLIGAIGLAIIGAGISQFFMGVKKRLQEQISPYKLDAQQRRWIFTLGRIGYIARGVVFFVTGALLVYAAFTLDPSKVGGLDKALQVLAQQPYGKFLLGLSALGLIAFGLYSFLGAAWFRIKQK